MHSRSEAELKTCDESMREARFCVRCSYIMVLFVFYILEGECFSHVYALYIIQSADDLRCFLANNVVFY